MIELNKAKEIIKKIAEKQQNKVLVDNSSIIYTTNDFSLHLKALKNYLSFVLDIDKIHFIENNIKLQDEKIKINEKVEIPYHKYEVEYYPIIAERREEDEKLLFAITVERLLNLLQYNFTRKDEKVFPLSFFLIETNTKEIKVISTDGRRLCVAKTEYASHENKQIFIHKEHIQKLLKILKIIDDKNTIIGVYEGRNYLLFRTNKEEISFFIKKYDIDFPSYEKVFPSEEPKCIFAIPYPKQLLSFLKKICEINKHNFPIQIDVYDKLIIKYETEIDVIEEFPVAFNSKIENPHIHLNPMFLLDVLKAIKNDKYISIEVKYYDKHTPLQLSYVIPSVFSTRYTFLIAPITCNCNEK